MEIIDTLNIKKDLKYTRLIQYVILPNEKVYIEIPDGFEACIVFTYGKGELSLDNKSYEIATKENAFEFVKPDAVYLTPLANVSYEAHKKTELIVLLAPGTGKYKSRIIDKNNMSIEHRGFGSMKRDIINILDEHQEAENLLVVEVFTKGGNWSSFPPHRHDEDNLPVQSYLEEIYFHKLNPEEGGFALQYVYNDERTVDECHVITNNKIVFVEKGYHPVSVPPGYDSYYLNVMAGPIKTWKFYTDPNFKK